MSKFWSSSRGENVKGKLRRRWSELAVVRSGRYDVSEPPKPPSKSAAFVSLCTGRKKDKTEEFIDNVITDSQPPVQKDKFTPATTKSEDVYKVSSAMLTLTPDCYQTTKNIHWHQRKRSHPVLHTVSITFIYF